MLPDRLVSRGALLTERWGRPLTLLAYVAAALIVVGPTLARSDLVTGHGVDLPGTLWIHWWVGQTVAHHELPIWTNLLFYPGGKNFFDDTGANFIDAYLSIPFQAIFGVPNYLDAFDFVILVVNAILFERLAYTVNGGNRPAAIAAAIVFELNPYVLQQLDQGRPTQAMLWFAIEAARHLYLLRDGTWKNAALFGLHTVLQGLTYWFMVYFIVVSLFVLAATMLVQEARRVAPRLLLAMAVCGAIAAPFVLKIRSEIDSGHVSRITYDTWADSPVGMPTRWRFVVSQFLQVTWISVIVAALAYVRQSWKWLAGFVLVFLFAVGPSLDVSTPNLQNPFFIALWEHVPFLTRLGFPERVACMGFITLGVAGAIALARVDFVWSGLIACIAVGEAWWRGSVPLDGAPFSFPPAVDVVKDQGGAVIALPFGYNEDAMVFQTRHGQPLFGGMGEKEEDLRPKAYSERLDNTFVMMLGGTINDTLPPIGYTAADREAIASQFRWVWLDTRLYPPKWNQMGYDLPGKIRRFTKELGEPVASDGSMILWDLHAPVTDPPGLSSEAVMATAATKQIFEFEMSGDNVGHPPGTAQAPGVPGSAIKHADGANGPSFGGPSGAGISPP